MERSILLVGLVSLVLMAGCTESNNTQITEACSNAKYSTINLSSQVDYPYITLTQSSQRQLEQALMENGSTALQDINDLHCLTWLDLSGFPIANVSPLASLNNLRYLDVSYTSLADPSSLTTFNSLEVLNLAGTNLSRRDCKNLDNRTAKTKVICPD